ncbi:MAG: outer membrane beta-barrel domain-containing protein, partial [Bdellovibrionaceae bacterium]|nr:outer membrane beta-barrel domain-containing protein [Pseudobdellovibrionaceae bacterium]
ITPRWSIGGRYATHFNSLTAEGRAAYEDARQRRLNDPNDPNIRVAPTDHPEHTMLGTITWYPVYGKTNLFDLAVVQFDLYTLAGYGRVKLASGWSDAITAGGGIGMWLSQHVSSRIEGRWQTYEDRPDNDPRRLNVGILTVSLGLML